MRTHEATEGAQPREVALVERIPGWLRFVTDGGILVSDTEQVKAVKRLTNVSLASSVFAYAPYAVAAAMSDDRRGAWYAWTVLSVHALWLVIHRLRGNWFPVLSRLILWFTIGAHGLVFPWLMGGPTAAAMAQVWALFMLTYGVMFFPSREAIRVAVACISVAVVLVALTPFAPAGVQWAEPWGAILYTTNAAFSALMISIVLYVLRHERESNLVQVEQQRRRADDLLLNILPAQLADELIRTGTTKPARHEEASVMFIDIVGFTQASSTIPADRLVRELNELFSAFDDLCANEGVEKIKTIGDAYMATAGVPDPVPDHAARCASAALRILDFVEERNRRVALKCTLRVGIHSGALVSGVVGKRKYSFDIWGDTVNIAARMESAGEPGKVNVSAYTFDLLMNDFEGVHRGRIEVKGKGAQDMYFVTGRKAAAQHGDQARAHAVPAA